MHAYKASIMRIVFWSIAFYSALPAQPLGLLSPIELAQHDNAQAVQDMHAYEQFSCDLQKFSHEKAKQHEQRLQQQCQRILGQRLAMLNVIARDRERVSFTAHSAEFTQLCKGISLREWQAITNGQSAQSVLNAPYFLQYDNYRAMVKAAPQYNAWVAQVYVAMKADKAYDAEWRKIPHNTHAYIYNEGKAAYAKLQKNHAHERLKNNKKPVSQSAAPVDNAAQKKQYTYTLPHTTQHALHDAGIASELFQQCLGSEEDHALQQRACELVVGASELDDECALQRAVIFEVASDSIVAREAGNRHEAQQLLDVGNELRSMHDNAIQGQQASLSSEAVVRYAAKAVELCCDFGVGLGKGAVASALRTVNLAIHPTELLQEIGNAIASIKTLQAELVDAARDIAYIHFPGISQHDKKIVAQRILERQEKYTQFAEHVVDSIQNMSAQEAAAFVGCFACDAFTGKAVGGVVTGFVRRTNVLLEVVKKSEKIAEVSDVVSKRYQTVVQKLKSVEDRVKNVLGTADQPQALAAGTNVNVPPNVMARTSGGQGAGAKEVIRATTKQILEQADKLGFKKTNYYSHGQRVYQKGSRFITADVDSHCGGFWKMADSVENLASKKTRMGTYDQLLNRIGD